MSELIERINWVDIFALILLIRISYISSRIGVSKQILPFLLLVLILFLTLYYHRKIEAVITSGVSISPSLCMFLSYILIIFISSLVYRIVWRITGVSLPVGEGEIGGIEKTGGAILGILRSIIIIGLTMIGLLLFPIKFTEVSVKSSYSGFFFVSTNLRVYALVANLIFRKSKILYQSELQQLLSEKKDYLFESLDLKKKSRFFREKY